MVVELLQDCFFMQEFRNGLNGLWSLCYFFLKDWERGHQGLATPALR